MGVEREGHNCGWGWHASGRRCLRASEGRSRRSRQPCSTVHHALSKARYSAAVLTLTTAAPSSAWVVTARARAQGGDWGWRLRQMITAARTAAVRLKSTVHLRQAQPSWAPGPGRPAGCRRRWSACGAAPPAAPLPPPHQGPRPRRSSVPGLRERAQGGTAAGGASMGRCRAGGREGTGQWAVARAAASAAACRWRLTKDELDAPVAHHQPLLLLQLAAAREPRQHRRHAQLQAAAPAAPRSMGRRAGGLPH